MEPPFGRGGDGTIVTEERDTGSVDPLLGRNAGCTIVTKEPAVDGADEASKAAEESDPPPEEAEGVDDASMQEEEDGIPLAIARLAKALDEQADAQAALDAATRRLHAADAAVEAATGAAPGDAGSLAYAAEQGSTLQGSRDASEGESNYLLRAISLP